MMAGPRRSLNDLERLIDEGQRLAVSTIVLYEWWRGPRSRAELAAQQELFPVESGVSFGPDEAALAARLYRELRKARGREVDIAIAACAIVSAAAFWTLNPGDFRDIPGLRLV